MTREEIFDTVQSLAREKDLYAASEFVLGLWDETEVAKVNEDLLLDCYWKARSVAQVIHFAAAGIHNCLAQACERDEGDDSARELRFAAKTPRFTRSNSRVPCAIFDVRLGRLRFQHMRVFRAPNQ